MIKLRDYEIDWLCDVLDGVDEGDTFGLFRDNEAEEDFGKMSTNLIAEIIREKLEEDNG